MSDIGEVDRLSDLTAETGTPVAQSSFFYNIARDPDIFALLNEDDLPETAHEIVGVIGLPHAINLFKTLGGISFPVPKGTNKNRWGTMRFLMLVECIGVDAAKAFCFNYGGSELYIPKCQQAIQKIRNRRIVREFDNGAQIKDLALMFRLTERQIQTIMKTTVS